MNGIPLQWGRDAVVAERRRLTRARDGGASFNGAATLWSRKAIPPEGQGHAAAVLQWGRDAVVAERVRPAVLTSEATEASMGPRRCGRGKVDTTSLSQSGSISFNGAATLWSRKGQPPVHLPGHDRHASMGPRRCGRGKRIEMGLNQPGDAASMGPRRCGRGKAGASAGSSLTAGCFNGAATLWSRKDGQPRRREGDSRASMGPRRCGRGKRRSRGPGRRRNKAPLQWGRDAVVAERRSIGKSSRQLPWLQWGRDAVVAESGLPATVRVMTGGLQWGRDAVVAERNLCRHLLRHALHASMGPRRCGRGKLAA